ncbi:tRNA-splicing endonuclease subunit Sen15-like isoform X1 [Mercenaria mercenaria]|uniref:tRNA-splicing endonuclease subunit Sen15-like isoform X1 n=1 Tax=Mercenaria mercenaria TaxID=6596 RepID=UPI00234E888F|nr:tRNA-splicing endonuclease subunit Sen15-like isoform X1 [Mercenaria mercenaria]XP_045200759.2 tRNA-splicing endonuclease subunit Sen15-like isoform X1 [Mercenaria mercenaria]
MSAVQLKDHPVWKDIQEYNTPDKIQAQIAFMVYMELCEDKGWWNMKTHLCQELSVVFLSGHASRNKPREIIIPMSADTVLNPAQIQTYILTVKIPDHHTNSVILAICGEDSGTVYYKLTDGLVPPDPPDLTDWKKYRREEIPDLKRHHVSDQTAMYINRKQAKTSNAETNEENNT